ncbi:MAG TPA: ParB/Srx family N-terminal domain-containing protein, partial [Candidatus Sulfotelmatobacter sp.]|nr:ParB/Srx family N-terminal domain-containing protein [Candidatus Sulfotelmatobacter sp.]
VDPYIEDYVGSVGTVISKSFVQCSTEDRQFLAYGNLKFYRPKDKAVDKDIAFWIETSYGAKRRDYAIQTKDMAIRRLQDSRSSEHDFEYISALSTTIFDLPIDAVPSHDDFESRARIIADYILPKDQFRAFVIGETALERDITGENSTRRIVRVVVDIFNPVAWYEDLKSDNRLTRVFGGLGFVGFAGGIFGPAIAGAKGSIAVARAGATLRISMPQVGKLLGKSAVSMIASLNPADGVGTIVQGVWKLGSKAVVGLTGAARSLALRGAEAFKSLRGIRPDDTVALLRNMETDPGRVSAKQIVDGMPNVSVGQNAMGNIYLLDAPSGRLYGPRLAKISHDGRLSSQVHDTIAVQQVQGRYVIADQNPWPAKSWLIDKHTHSMTLTSEGLVVANYRLDDGSLLFREVDKANGARPTRTLEIVPCRSKRQIELVPCATDLRSFQTKNFTTEINFDRKDYMPWFGQARFTSAPGSFVFVCEGKIYTGKNRVLEPVAANEIESLGSDISPVYRDQISATIMGGSPDFKQIRITEGIDARIPDTREISAFLAEHGDTGKPWIVTEADTGKFYFGEVPADGPVTMKRVDIEDDVLDGSRPPETDEEELAVAMRGALSANSHYRMFPNTVVLENSFDKLEKLLLENSIPDYLLGRGSRFKYDTTDAQAIMYAARPRVAFNTYIDERLAWPASLPVDPHVLEANSKFFADALNKLLKKNATFSPTDFITARGARSAVQRLRAANDGKDSAVAWVRLANGKTEVHYAGFDLLDTAQSDGQRWLSAERLAGEPYVDDRGLSLPPLAGGSRIAAMAGPPSVESRIINIILHDHPAPGTLVQAKVWVAGTRDPASPFFYQAFDNPGVQLRVHDPASNLLMADIEQMRRITPQSWKATDKSTLPAGVESAIDDDLAFAGGVPYVYTWKDGRKSYVAWVPEENSLVLREGDGSNWGVPERYDYQEIDTWRTPEGTEPTVNPFEVDFGRKDLDPVRLERAKQGIRDGVLLPPVAIRSIGEGKFTIQDGNHRLRAARDLGLQKIPYRLVD